jgi:FkbM family methyltransferase
MIKIGGVAAGRRAGPYMPLSGLRRSFRHRIANRLMDAAVLTPGLRPLRTRECSTPLLADPYIYTHHTIYWFRRLYEPHTGRFLKRWLSPGDVAIDVGMNLGHFTTFAAELVGPGGQVIAFEPNPRLCESVAAHLSAHNLRQVEIRNLALGPREGTVTLSVPADSGSSFVADITGRSPDAGMCAFEVPMRRADDELATIPSDRLVLKIDVEGAELDVLNGMRQTLADRVVAGQIEISPQWLSPDKLTAIQQLLADSGFQTFLAKDSAKPEPIMISEMTSQMDVWFIRPGQ